MMLRQRTILSEQKGLTLVEIMISILVSVIGVFAISSILINLGKAQQRSNFLLALSQLRLSFQQAITREADWNATVSQNTSMQCFLGSTNGGSPLSCSGVATTPTAMALYSGVAGIPTLIYDSRLQYSGYTTAGVACGTFNSSAPDPAGCVLKPVLTWQLQCNSTVDPTCLGPSVIVNLTYLYNGPSFGAVDFTAYGFKMTLSTFPIRVAQPCTGLIPICPPVVPPATIPLQVVCVGGIWTCEEFGL